MLLTRAWESSAPERENGARLFLLGHTTFTDLPDRAYEAYVVGRRADRRFSRWRDERLVDSVVYGVAIP